ncbi:MAG: hypothetical protein FJY74_07805 [Candidatus Eisenbacteria bacterium]|nr:hypothetical protein [Candidatus Eisenbacteria bacterium]
MNDTLPDVAARYRRMIMALAPAERAAMAGRMFEAARALVVAGIRERLGADVSERRLREEIFLAFYGRDFAAPERERILAHLRAA